MKLEVRYISVALLRFSEILRSISQFLNLLGKNREKRPVFYSLFGILGYNISITIPISESFNGESTMSS